MTEPTVQQRMHILFVCSRNQWRSPTAENVWRKHPRLQVRSAGTSASAKKRVTEADVEWADVIFVMEQKHKTKLRADFGDQLTGKVLHVLDIPDEYQAMDPELVQQLEQSVAAILGL
jgi:predicted protein tyrosine phosphatase